MARIPKSEYSSIYDLGCGTGHLTRILADTFANSTVAGIDSSPDEAAKFIDAFAERMGAAYPVQPNGQTLFPFRRLFLVAQR